MEYKPRDRIFAKVKGHPHWPSRINILPEDVKVPKGKFPIFFYGTHEVYFLASKDIFPYEKWKHKYAVNKNRPVFQKGLDEIENNPDILLYGTDPKAEGFLSQFYSFKRSAESDPSIKNYDTEQTEYGGKKDQDQPAAEQSTSKTLIAPVSITTQPKAIVKDTNKRCHSANIVTPHPAKRSDKYSTPKLLRRKSPEALLSSEGKLDGNKPTKETQDLSDAPPKIVERETVAATTSTPPPATTALGRPVRKSASQFSARKLLKSGIAIDSDEDSCDDADWNPAVATKKDNAANIDGDGDSTEGNAAHVLTISDKQHTKTSKLSLKRTGLQQNDDAGKTKKKLQRCPSSSSSETDNDSTDTPVSDASPPPRPISARRRTSMADEDGGGSRRRRSQPSPSHLPPRRIKHKRPRRDGSDSRSPVVSSSTSSLKERLKNANVSMSQEELQDRLASKRLNEKCVQKQLKELGAEARLHIIDRAIKISLIRGQEDIPTCLQRMESLEKMGLTLPVLVKCSAIIETIRKCCRYKPSLEVKIAALKVFNRFIKLQENASKEDLEKAHAELMESNKRTRNSTDSTSNAQSQTSLPQTVSDLFQLSTRQTQQSQPSQLQKFPISLSVPTPIPSTQVQASTALPPQPSLQLSSVSPFAEVTSTTAEPIPPPPPPPPPPPTPPRPPSPPKQLPQHVEEKNDSTDSEGLAPSIGGDETASDSDEEPFAPLAQPQQPQPPTAPSTTSTLNVEATLAAVKQAFLLRTRDKATPAPTVHQPPPKPPSPLPPPPSDAYVPQSLHPSGGPLPAYAPCLPHPPLMPLQPPPPPQSYIPLISTSPPPPYPPFSADLSRPPPPIPRHLPPPQALQQTQQQPQPNRRLVDPRLSPEQRRRAPARQRAPSPHALPHPLEHYQRFLNTESTVAPQPMSHSGDDLDTRIARLLEAAGPQSPHQPPPLHQLSPEPSHQHHQQQQHFHVPLPSQPPPPMVLSPPPPPPPLPASQNLILAHRPNNHHQQQQAVNTFTPASPVVESGNGSELDSINMLGNM